MKNIENIQKSFKKLQLETYHSDKNTRKHKSKIRKKLRIKTVDIQESLKI